MVGFLAVIHILIDAIKTLRQKQINNLIGTNCLSNLSGMPQELYIDNPDGSVFSLAEWETAVEKTDKVRLETSLEDTNFTFEDAEIFDEETGQWHPALRWSQHHVAFNARTVHFFSDQDPIWKTITTLADNLGAKIRDEEGNICFPEHFNKKSREREKPKAENLGRNPPEYKTKLEIWFKFKTINGPELAEEVASWLNQAGVSRNVFVGGRKVSLGRIPEAVDGAAYPDFRILTSEYGFSYISPRAFEYDLFSISKITSVPEEFWEKVLKQFCKSGSIVSARLINCEFERWQNRENLLFYETQNRPHDHLPKIRRDAPPPLDKWIIDISNNPGRIVRSKGILEAIGGIMWLSDEFFRITGSDKENVKNAVYFNCEESCDFMKITIDKDLLKNGDTESELINKQRNLRRLLFPKGSESTQ